MYAAMSSPTPPPSTRKRPAPGANPLPAGLMQQAPQQYAPAAPQDNMMRWNGMAANGNNFADVSNQYMPNFTQQQQQPSQAQPQQPHPQQHLNQRAGGQQAYQNQAQAQPQLQNQAAQNGASNVIALRDNPSRALVSAVPNTGFDGQADQWANTNTETALVPATNGRVHEPDPEQQLREAVARARKIEEEATKEGSTMKRSIPPFVQKLSSYLDNGKNSDLIRWSEKGDSFIVLDEDEFAKNLIPEMFKHNNYASFVRQLNMYGFHKRVGLSDNSMRASEKKNKSPSEYAHQYFRRGYDVLHWLIQKPNKNSGKRKGTAKRDVPEVIEADSDEDFIEDGTPAYTAPGVHGRSEAGPLAKPAEMSKFREQLAEVQQKQQQVLAMIHGLRQNQENLMQKAHRVEQMHQRHENSITAILNFLANVFRKSLEGKGSAENLSEMLASILPLGSQTGIPTGTVQDLGDLGEYLQQQNVSRNSMSPGPQKRQQHLLPGIPAKKRASAQAPGPGEEAAATGYQAPQSRVTEVYDNSPSDTTSPNYYRNELQSNPQEMMMKIMGATNAQMTPGVNLPEVAAATSASMPHDQRNQMLDSMSQRTVSPGQNRPASAFPPPSNHNIAANISNMPRSGSMPPAGENPVRPSSNSSSQPQTALSPVQPSLSPVMGNIPRPPAMDLTEVNQQRHQLDQIENHLGEVGSGIDNLAHFAGQFSPNGHIPGYNGHEGDVPEEYFLNDPSLDVNQFLNLDNHNYNFDFNDPANFDFSVNNADQNFGGHGDPPTVADGMPPAATPAAQDTPSPAVTEEIQRTDLDGVDIPSAKRRRQA